MQELVIPAARVAVLIGNKGKTKKTIENKTNTKIKVSGEGDVVIEGDPLNCFLAEKIVRAVGRGFNPNIALQLCNEDCTFEIIKITDFSKKSKSRFIRIKARLIGTKGKARNTIEHLTNTNVVVYGKTVSIIGKHEDVLYAKRAIDYLLGGAPHGNVYKFLEEAIKKRDENKS